MPTESSSTPSLSSVRQKLPNAGLSHDELLQDVSSGEVKPISEWATQARPIHVRAYDFTNRGLKIVLADAPVEGAEEDLVEVWTDVGYKIRCSRNHKFYTPDRKWIPISQLRVGAEIGTTLGLPIMMEPKFTRVAAIRPLPDKGKFYSISVPNLGNFVHDNVMQEAGDGK